MSNLLMNTTICFTYKSKFSFREWFSFRIN